MANPEHIDRLQDGVDSWNQWRVSSDKVDQVDLSGAQLPKVLFPYINLFGADLRGADLSQADLREATLTWAQLDGSDLNGADLSRAYVVATHLRNAKLCGANLQGAHCREAHFQSANLTRAILRETDLQGADLSGANLSGAYLGQTTFSDTNLTGAKGLESCIHMGPSSVGIDTVFKSCGTIPESFFRGCGVPEPFITYAPSMILQPVEFYSCFISYSSHDQAFAERLHADLRAKSLRCWFAPEDLKIGDRFQERIEESIQLFDKVMIVLSKASVQSRWVEREVNAAREREERQNRIVLFPIRLDDTVMSAPQPWAADIRRTRHIGDFREWEAHTPYEKAFERLLRDLKATERVSDQPA